MQYLRDLFQKSTKNWKGCLNTFMLMNKILSSGHKPLGEDKNLKSLFRHCGIEAQNEGEKMSRMTWIFSGQLCRFSPMPCVPCQNNLPASFLKFFLFSRYFSRILIYFQSQLWLSYTIPILCFTAFNSFSCSLLSDISEINRWHKLVMLVVYTTWQTYENVIFHT